MDMVDLVAKHPELLALIKEHSALAQRYQEARREAARKKKTVGRK